MKTIYLSLICFLFISACESKNGASGSSSQDLEVILSDELEELGVHVISESVRETGDRAVRIFIILDKRVSQIINDPLIFKALTKDDFELVGGLLLYESIEVSYNNEYGIPASELTNRGFIYSQSLNPMDVNLIKKIKIETYRR